MDTPASEPVSRIRVGDLEIDVGLQRVVRDGVQVPLPKLSFDLLLVLVRAAPNFIPHRELLARVWPGLVVADKTVSQRVKLLRDALGDNPNSPRYIAGLRGRGYRLIVPVQPLDAIPADTPVGKSDISGANRGRVSRAFAALGIVAVLAAATSVLVVLATRPVEDRMSATEALFDPERALLVLPFRDEGDGSDESYLGAGIAESLIETLSGSPGLTTIARDSAFRLAERALPLTVLADEIHVRFVLDGSVLRSDDNLRVAVTLLDTARNDALWSGSFDGRLDEIFEIENAIAGSVATVLALEPDSDRSRSAASRAPDVDAYLAYLRGRAALDRWTAAEARIAEGQFAMAVELDPEFAAAYASLYDARMLAADRLVGGASPNVAESLFASPLAAVREANVSLIERALALDPDCGAAYFARAIWAGEDSPAREQDFRLGLVLEPSNGRGIVAFAEYLDRTGRQDEAGRLLERAIAVDPVSPRAHFRRVQRQFPRDPASLESGMLGVLAIDPAYQPALQRYAKYRWLLHGELAEAAELIERALADDPGNPWLIHTAVAIYLDLGEIDTARALVASAERPDVAGDLLIQLADGRLDLLETAVFADSAFANGRLESWGVYEAVRDVALETRDAASALEYLERRTGLPAAEPDMENFRAVPAVAELLMASGRATEARDLLAATIRWIDDYHLPRAGTIYALRVKAAALQLLGERELALDSLDTSFRGQDYLQWWYTLERDQLWSPLHGDPRFTAIAARVHDHVRNQSEALAALRLQGRVPVRAGSP